MTKRNFPESENRDDNADAFEQSHKNMNDDLSQTENPYEERLDPDKPIRGENQPSTATDRPESQPYTSTAEAGYRKRWSRTAKFNPAEELSYMAAQGGAVGGFVLGIWSIICAFITYFAIINAVIAILLGLYGLNSRLSRLAGFGIALGAIAAIMSLMEVSEIVGTMFETSEET